jgi:hypothetical protein
MPTFAEIDALRHQPEPAYPEYQQVRTHARTDFSPHVDPAGEVDRMQAVLHGRGRDWAMGVLGFWFDGDLRSLSLVESRMLLVADQLDLQPPLPTRILDWNQQWDRLRREQQASRDRAAARDRQRWQEALARCQVAVEVRPNIHGRRYGGWDTSPLRHVVPLNDACSGPTGRRRHPAGRALCETPTRRRPLQLGEPTDQPATCVRCLAYTPLLRSSAGWEAG